MNTVLRWNCSEEIALKVKWLLWGRLAMVRTVDLEWRLSFSTISIYSHHGVGIEASTHLQLLHRERAVIVSWERLRTGDLLFGEICELVFYLFDVYVLVLVCTRLVKVPSEARGWHQILPPGAEVIDSWKLPATTAAPQVQKSSRAHFNHTTPLSGKWLVIPFVNKKHQP